MPIKITMPRLSDTMEEGTIVKWYVKVGDEVSSGDHLADVETDKATMEHESFDDGTVALIAVEEGQTVAVESLMLVLAEDGESIEEAAKAAGDAASSAGASSGAAAASAGGDASSEDTGSATAVADAPAATPPKSNGRIRVSPVAAKIAEEHGLDLNRITGTGPDGRIIKRDVLALTEGGAAATASTPAAPAPGAPASASAPAPQMTPVARSVEAKSIPLTNMRKTIAKRLVESKTTIPHFTETISVNADPLLDVRKQVNAALEPTGVKLSVNDYIVRAAALALCTHPELNSVWAHNTIEQPGTVNIGVAVALPAEKGGGLVVPTLRDAHNMPLPTISSETKRLAKKARDTGLTLEEMADGTFTISNLGMFGIDHFEAIISPPQCAILAVGAAIEKPVARNGELTIGNEMLLTLSADHRVADGAVAAMFLNTLKQLLENPAGLLV